MIEVLDNRIALDHMSGYFDRLSLHGFVGEKTTQLFMRYLFLADFTDLLCTYISDADYAQINRMLNTMFGTGNCLLPYPVFCDRRTKVSYGSRGRMVPRITESMAELRITENEKLRRV